VGATPDMSEVGRLLRGIPGYPPVAGKWPTGCRFRPRCEFAREGCEQRQELRQLPGDRKVRCVLVDGEQVQ
jgi:oligopeptide/dipeptide ABC transporter ATP-binding protein